MLIRIFHHRLVGLALILAFLADTFAPMSEAQGQIIFVNASATGANTGDSWANAFVDLQSALGIARPGTEIWVAAGTYYPIIPANPSSVNPNERTVSFQLVSGVAIFGGFAGNENSGDQRDPAANTTFLSGDIDRNDNANNFANNSRHVVIGSGTDASAILDGVVVVGGNASEVGDAGGGILNVAGSPTLRNIAIEGNQARNGGGMANIQGSSPTIISANFIGNVAFSNGGGVYNDSNSNPSFTDVFIGNNQASNQFTGGGGGVYNLNSSPSFNNATIRGNNVLASGGGVYNDENSSPSFINTTIVENESRAEEGGGVHNFNSSPSFENVVIENNRGSGVLHLGESNSTYTTVRISGNQGNGVTSLGGTSSFSNATISDNQNAGLSNTNTNMMFVDGTISGNQQNGVFNEGSSPTFIDVAITGNRDASLGGGVYNRSQSNPVFINVTIANNESGGIGGGMYNFNNSNPALLNTRITGNLAEQGGGVFNRRSAPRLTNVVISGNRASSDGGGLYNDTASDATLTNVTISNNQAPAGGGIFLEEGTLRIRNSIVWGNNAARGAQFIIATLEDGSPLGQLLFDHTLVQGVDLSGERTGNLDGTGDPQFVAPVNPDRTPTSEGDYQIQPGSTAVDRGARLFLDETQEVVPDLNGDSDEQDVLTERDLAGNQRIAGAEVDLGAFESGSSPAPEPPDPPAPPAPSIRANVNSGAPGSQFLVSATNVPPDTPVTIAVNDLPVTGGQAQGFRSDAEGNLRMLIDTAAADPGYYVISLEVAGLAQPLATGLRLKPDAPVRQPAGEGDIVITLPAGIARTLHERFLPLAARP